MAKKEENEENEEEMEDNSKEEKINADFEYKDVKDLPGVGAAIASKIRNAGVRRYNIACNSQST